MYRITEVTLSGGVAVIRVAGEDKEEKYLVAKEFFAPIGVDEGDMIGDGELEALEEAAVLTAACAKALDVISYSSVSRRALTDKLRLKYKYEKDVADAAADYAVRRGFLDEERQAERIAERDVDSKLHGRRRVFSDLFAKGYPKEVCDAAADSVGKEKYDGALRRLADKKAPSSPPDRGTLEKLIASFVRAGHSPSDAARILKEKYSRNKEDQ